MNEWGKALNAAQEYSDHFYAMKLYRVFVWHTPWVEDDDLDDEPILFNSYECEADAKEEERRLLAHGACAFIVKENAWRRGERGKEIKKRR